ncbi:MAG: cyclic nucleotide-binding domain-containing protein [Paracoccaceae bacterium]
MGLLIGLLSLIVTTSYVSVVFSGPLEPHRPIGLSMALFGSVVYGLAATYASSVRGVWWGSQSAPVVMTSVGVSSLVAGMAGTNDATLFATAVLFIMTATFLSGLVLLLLGRARLGPSAKFIPYPVVGGFLAATGVYLLIRGAGLAVPGGASGPEMLTAEAARHWWPYVAGGFALTLIAQRTSHAVALALGIVATTGGFFAYIALSDMTLASAMEQGLLLGASPTGIGGLSAGDLPRLGEADVAAIAGEANTLLALAGLSVLALVMNISGLELQLRGAFNLNREFRSAGLANMIGAAGGGFVGFHSASMFQVSHRLLPEPRTATNLAATSVVALGFAGALGAIAYLPVGLFALVLCLLGFELLWRWLVEAWRTMPRSDYAIILVILTITLAFDFVTAVLAGIVIASLLFTAAYSRINVIRNRVTARLRQSPTERPEADTAILSRKGEETVILELEGYLFFGTANTLYETVASELKKRTTPLRNLILDFRRVQGVDVSTAYVMARITDMVRRERANVLFSAMSGAVSDRLSATGVLSAVDTHRTLADALGAVEDSVLHETRIGHAPGEPPATAFGLLISRAAGLDLPLVAERRTLAAGQTLFHQGDAGDSLAYLENGRLSAWVRSPTGSGARVASFLPGAVVGEIAFCTGTTRTASVVADSPCRIAVITRASLDAAARTHPEIAAEFHAILSRLLSGRLGRTTALLHALDR